MRTFLVAALLIVSVPSVALAQSKPTDVCKALSTEGRATVIKCYADIGRPAFVQALPELSTIYDKYYDDLGNLGNLSDQEHWPKERFAVEMAKLKVPFTVAIQETRVRRQLADEAQQEFVERELAKKERAAESRRRLGAALQAFGNAKNPPSVTTTCQTYPGPYPSTTCRSR